MNWRRATVLVTGGTGTFGWRFVETVLRERHPRKVIVFSRDEHKQHDMRRAGLDAPDVEHRVGDVRDAGSVREAMRGVDVVVHAAALKQVPLGEAQPGEAIRTNVLGAENVAEAAIEAGVARVAALSTDKAVQPVNVYGATKLLAERLFLRANARGDGRTRLCCIRYGNVLGSRSSLVPALLDQRTGGRISLTDRRMTRFWMTLDEAVGLVLRCVDEMEGGEVFVPKARAARIVDLARAIAPDCVVQETGRRPGEKIHEVLVSEDEAPYTVERGGLFVIRPGMAPMRAGGSKLGVGRYASDEVDPLSVDELRALLSASGLSAAPAAKKRQSRKPARHARR